MINMTPERKQTRLPGYDYSRPGMYFVTVVTHGRERLFGDIAVGVGFPDPFMQLNEYGRLIEIEWKRLTERFTHILLDEFIVMPNHIHGIIEITHMAQPGGETPPLRRWTLGQIVAYFKYNSTTHVNILHNEPGIRIWQRNYYDHIIRDDEDLQRVREYIRNNPITWHEDELFN